MLTAPETVWLDGKLLTPTVHAPDWVIEPELPLELPAQPLAQMKWGYCAAGGSTKVVSNVPVTFEIDPANAGVTNKLAPARRTFSLFI